MEKVQVVPAAEEGWRWFYSDGNGARAFSNEFYVDLTRAIRSAEAAYPDLPLVVERPVVEEHPNDRRDHGRLLRILVYLSLAALAFAWGWKLSGSLQRN